MEFTKLTLDNIRSYDNETIHFDSGSNMLYGKNGAGKSSILQALFGGLFQTAVRSHIGNDFTLDDLVRHGEDEGRIEVTFERGGHEYTIEWILTVTEDEDGERSAKTKHGYPVLESDALPEPEAGVRNVRDAITNDVLGMNAESFVNSVYVQQGDMSRLIHANSDERREILDRLLGLSRLDELIERMDKVRLECKRARNDAKTLLDDSRKRLDEMDDEDDVKERVEELNAKVSEKQERLEELEGKIDRLKDARSKKKAKLDGIDDLRDEISDLDDELEDERDELARHKQKIEDETAAKQEAEDAKQEAENDLDEAIDADAIDHVDADLTDHDEAEAALDDARGEVEDAQRSIETWREHKLSNLTDDLSRLQDDLEDAEADAASARESKGLAEEKLERAREDKQEAQQRVDDIKANLDEKRDAIADAAAALDLPSDASLDDLRDTHIPEKRDAITDEKVEVEGEITRLNTLEEQVHTLQADKQCPVCKASEEDGEVDADAVAEEHAEQLAAHEERRDELDEMKSDLDDLESDVREALALRDDTLDEARDAIADAESDIEDAEEGIERFEGEIEDAEDEIERLKGEIEETQDDIEDAREEIEAFEQAKQTHQAAVVALKDVVDAHERIDKYDEEASDHQQNIDHANEMRRQTRRQVKALEAKIGEKQDELDDRDPETLEDQLDQIKGRLAERRAERENVSDAVESLREDRADARTELKNIREEKEHYANAEEQRNWAEERRSEAEEVKEAYRDVRAELRERNLKLLRKYTNEVFDELYQHESYRGVYIDEEYDISLLAADNEQLKPELSSGGEGAVLNLALRVGVYKIIAQREGVAGAALPPLILDEPSTHLDGDHVGELQTMIDTVSEWDVPQILVVDHDRHLIENADTAFEVKKDKKTKTSTALRDGSGGGGDGGDGGGESADGDAVHPQADAQEEVMMND